jgi:hypothetical protein
MGKRGERREERGERREERGEREEEGREGERKEKDIGERRREGREGERREERGLDLGDLESIFIIALAALTHDPRPHALHAASSEKGLFDGRVNMRLNCCTRQESRSSVHGWTTGMLVPFNTSKPPMCQSNQEAIMISSILICGAGCPDVQKVLG